MNIFKRIAELNAKYDNWYKNLSPWRRFAHNLGCALVGIGIAESFLAYRDSKLKTFAPKVEVVLPADMPDPNCASCGHDRHVHAYSRGECTAPLSRFSFGSHVFCGCLSFVAEDN